MLARHVHAGPQSIRSPAGTAGARAVGMSCDPDDILHPHPSSSHPPGPCPASHTTLTRGSRRFTQQGEVQVWSHYCSPVTAATTASTATTAPTTSSSAVLVALWMVRQAAEKLKESEQGVKVSKKKSSKQNFSLLSSVVVRNYICRLVFISSTLPFHIGVCVYIVCVFK